MTADKARPPAIPFEVIDSHIHYFLTSALVNPDRWNGRYTPEQIERMKSRFEKNLRERAQPPMDYSPATAADYARRWREELDANGVSRAVFLTLDDDPGPLGEFVALAPGRFIPYAHVDPLDPAAPAKLERQVREFGCRGLKLITTTQWFHPYDPAVYPLYEKAQELGIPVLVHIGVSIGYTADFRYANPLDMQPALRDFPDLQFLLAHFGAGFLREALLLCYQCDNVCLDTSSSNIWMKYQDHDMTITDVFRRALEAAGPSRIVFGTDSSYFPRGYRRDILDQQYEALRGLGASDADMALIFAGNIRRLLRL